MLYHNYSLALFMYIVVIIIFIIIIIHNLYYIQDQYTSSDCDLIPHYTDTTDGITFVSFTSAKYRCATITMQPDSDDIIVSTETTDKHQFRIISAVSVIY